jgi:chromosome segregation ATPase
LIQGELEDERTKDTRLNMAHTELQAKLHAKLSNAQSSGDPFKKQKEEVASLQNELSSAKKKIFEQSELLRNKEEKYLQDLQNLQTDLAAAMPASNGSREVELQKQVEQLTNKLSKQKDSLELELKLLRSETQSQISSYRSQIKFMEVKHAKELENEKGKAESATAKVAASEDSEMWENKMQNLQRKMGDLQKEIDETNDKYRKALAEAERASNSSKSLERQIEDLRRGHDEDLSSQKKRVRSLEDALAAERKDHVSQLQLLQDLNAKQREQMIEKHEAEISSQREKTELGASARLQTAERELEDLQKEIRALRRDKEGLKRDKEALLRKSEQFLVEKQRALQELKFSRKEYQQIMEKYTELKASSAATSSLGSSSVITRLETSMQGSDPATLGHAIQHALSTGLKENHPVVTRAIARLRVLMGASR